MTQDRRITDKLPGQPLDWSDTASPASNKAAADLTIYTSTEINEIEWMSEEKFVKLSDVAAPLSAAPAEEAKPVLWMLKTGHGDRYTEKEPTGEFADKWTPLYTRAAPAAQPDAETIDTPEFAHYLAALFTAPSGKPTADARNALIAYIDGTKLKSAAPTASQPDEARDAAAHEAGFVAGWNDAMSTARAEVRSMQDNLETFGSSSEETARIVLDGVLDAIDELKSAPTAASPSHPDTDLLYLLEYIPQGPVREEAKRRLSRAPVAPSHPDPVLTLSTAIMNLPCKPGRAIAMHGASEQAYREGHRDARHAAADLVLARADELVALTGSSHPVQQQEQGDEPVAYVVDVDTEQGEAVINAALPVGTQVFTRAALAQKG